MAVEAEPRRAKNGGESLVVPEAFLRSQSICSVRGSSISAAEEHDECHSLSHLGALIPLYLLPLLFLGIQFGNCAYSVLLPLLLWAFNAVPKPAAALTHLVTLPLLGLMSPEQVASHYLAASKRKAMRAWSVGGVNPATWLALLTALQVEVLTAVLLLLPVVVIDAWSEVVRSLAHGICARFGLRRGPLFAIVCTWAFISASFFSGLVTSVAILYFMNRVLFTIFREDMDRTPDIFSSGILRASQQETASVQSLHLGDQVLFDRLAQVVLTMKKPERRLLQPKKKNEYVPGSVFSPAVPSATPMQERRQRATPSESPKQVGELAGVVSLFKKAADPGHLDQAIVSCSPKEDIERTDAESTIKSGRKDGRLSRWRRKWFKAQSTSEPQDNSQPVTRAPANLEEGHSARDEKTREKKAKEQNDTAPTKPGSSAAVPGNLASHVVVDRGLVRLVLGSQENALNVMKPFALVGNEGVSKTQETKHVLQDARLQGRQQQREQPRSVAESKLALSQPFATDGETKRQVTVQSPTEVSLTKQRQGKRHGAFNLFPWRHERKRNSKDAENIVSPMTTRARPAWFRRISVFSGKVVDRSLSDFPHSASPPAFPTEQAKEVTQLQPAEDRPGMVEVAPTGRAENSVETGGVVPLTGSVLPKQDSATTSSPLPSEHSVTATGTNALLVPEGSSCEPHPEPPDLSSFPANRASGSSLVMANSGLERKLSKISARDTDLERITDEPTRQPINFAHGEIDKEGRHEADSKTDISGKKEVDNDITKVSAAGTSDEAKMADKKTGRETEASKLSRNKARSERDRSTSSRRRKRPGKKDASIGKKSPQQGSPRHKCAVAVSDQPPADPSDKVEEQRRTHGFDASALEGARRQTLGFDVHQILEADHLGANNNSHSLPPSTRQQQGAKVTDDYRRSCSEKTVDKPSSSLPEVSKPATTKAEEPESKHERAQGSSRDKDEPGQLKESRLSKSSVKSGRKSGRKSGKGHSGEAKKAAKVEPRPVKSEEVVPTQAPPIDKEEAVRRTETATPLENSTDAPETTEVPSTEKPSVGTGSSDKIATSDCSSAQRTQDPTCNTDAPTGQAFGNSRVSTSQAKRKQSAVSFGAGVKKPEEDEPSLMENADKALVAPEEVPSKSTQKRRLSTILKSSTSTTVRRASTVDFGPEECAFISPTRTAVSTRPPRRQSGLSMGSISSQGESDVWEQCKRPYSFRAARSRSCFFDDTISRNSISARPSLIGSHIGSQFGSMAKKTKAGSARENVHYAFLLGPSLMCVLGGMCSFHAAGNKKALKVVSHAADVTSPTISGVAWTMMTLPGAVVALVTCSAVIWLLYVRPHDPDPFSVENLSVMRAARERRAGRQRQRGVEFASAVYVAIFSLAYIPSLLLGADHRTAVLSALASMMLATSLLTSCLRAAFDFIRQIWELLPWGVLLLLGATQVASRLMQAYDLPREAFKLVSPSFWKERSSIEVQAILAVAASLLAETADKQVLVEMMAPVVVHIAEMRGMYPTYYAIPVIVGASSNVVMPASAPLAILHDMSRVSFGKLVLLGLFIKVVVLSMTIMTVNIAVRADMLINEAPVK